MKDAIFGENTAIRYMPCGEVSPQVKMVAHLKSVLKDGYHITYKFKKSPEGETFTCWYCDSNIWLRKEHNGYDHLLVNLNKFFNLILEGRLIVISLKAPEIVKTKDDLKPGDLLQTRSGYFYNLGKDYPFDKRLYRNGEHFSDLKYHDIGLKAVNGDSRSDIILVLRDGVKVFSSEEAIVFDKHPAKPKKENIQLKQDKIYEYFVKAENPNDLTGVDLAITINKSISDGGGSMSLDGVKRIMEPNDIFWCKEMIKKHKIVIMKRTKVLVETIVSEERVE